ncbi:MAG: moaD [Magnetococcales bacterium]|nr:moaD [Magnetococcales bacterium]HIJ84940.1 molybdopterin converting factor subunit 1 [Magnetococcales bacterium]
MARILYFAWVREKVGVAEERMALPDSVKTVAQVIRFLRGLDSNHDQALADTSLRVAVNQEYAQLETGVTNYDEIAFFPPVSGG